MRFFVVLVLATLLPVAASAQRPTPPKPHRPFTEADFARPPVSVGLNPFLHYLPPEELARVDWRFWRKKLAFDGRRRNDRRAAGKRAAARYEEQEPPGQRGRNDSPALAEPVAGAGTGPGDAGDLVLAGDLHAPHVVTGTLEQDPEDDGDILKATDSGLAANRSYTATGLTIGDGPWGGDAPGVGVDDFDFWKITVSRPNQLIRIDVDTPVPFGDLDPVAALYDAAGTLVAFNDDDDRTLDAYLEYLAPAPGAYYVSIGGWGAFRLNDPFDSGSGSRTEGRDGSEGAYDLTLALLDVDVDFYRIDLEAGDVIGASARDAAGHVSLVAPGGVELKGSGRDGSGIYPDENPLPGGGNAGLDYVAPVTGAYALGVRSGGGAYEVDVVLRRPNLEQPPGGARADTRQILFLDFDGAEIRPRELFGSGNTTAALSPLRAFLPRWGLTEADSHAVIDAVVEVFRENIERDLAAAENPHFSVEVRNSRDHADPFGTEPHVSRVIIGGTRQELGSGTIGVAESIDPGNFATGETAVVLLDLLSAGPDDPSSLNQYGLGNGATMIDLVGTGVGNLAAHEAGHYTGSWHTDPFNGDDHADVMDQGSFLDNTVGVGPNRVFETPLAAGAAKRAGGDDVDVDFGIDVFVPAEGYTGLENTRAITAFGLTEPAGVPLPVELTAMDALAEGADVVLSWQTASESNNAGFAVERRRGGTFVEEGFVPGAGSSAEARRYRFRVRGLDPGLHVFRLRQTDFDGAVWTSPEVEALVEVPAAFVLSEPYPNPFNPRATFSLGVAEAQPVRVTLFDALGRPVRTLHDGLLAPHTLHRFTIDGAGLPSGLYLVRADGAHFRSDTRRVMLLK